MNTHLRQCFFAVAAFLFSASTAEAQQVTPLQIQLQPWASGLAKPVGIYHCGDERLFVVEQDQGRIRILNSQGTVTGTFLNVGSMISTGGERGLLGLAFHPDYQNNGYFYINYYSTQNQTVIARYQVSAGNPNVADPNSAQIVMTIPQPYGNHNGGHIEFGPDGYLYIGMGDGGSAGDPQNYSQNNQSLLGKMLRIDVDNGSPYAIPPDNPFVGNAGVLDEIWATGIRNPWKFSFDRITGDMWMGDVGQNAWEEINFQPADSPGGENYGWRCYEGNAPYNTNGCGAQSIYEFPVAVVANNFSTGWCSVTGGVVYRGEQYPGMVGHYLFTDYCAGDIRAIVQDGAGNFNAHEALGQQGFGFVAFGEDADGELYVVRIGSGSNGTILKIADVCGDFAPVINLGDGALEAVDGQAWWWYLNGELIPGATSQTYTPLVEGDYYAVVSNGTCSRMSNTITFIGEVENPGCTDAEACNYDPEAVTNDGSCAFPGDACDDGNPDTEGTVWDENCACVELAGCTDETACNFMPNAVIDDGSCVFVELFEISGVIQAVIGETYTYTYPETTGSSYTWTVGEGEILSGQGTAEIEVTWDPLVVDMMLDIVSVTETAQVDGEACEGETVTLEVGLFLSIDEASLMGIEIFPNPASNIVTINPGSISSPMMAEVYDLSGRMVASFQVMGITTLDVGRFATGTYVLRLYDNEVNVQQRLMIAR